jgi:hypothetical protein
VSVSDTYDYTELCIIGVSVSCPVSVSMLHSRRTFRPMNNREVEERRCGQSFGFWRLLLEFVFFSISLFFF